MSIIIAFFCGLCSYTLADAIAEYISAKAHQIRQQTEIDLTAFNNSVCESNYQRKTEENTNV